MKTIFTLILLVVFNLTAAHCDENEIVDDFSKAVPGRWEDITGPVWHIKDGEFMVSPGYKDPNEHYSKWIGEYAFSMVVADFPMTTGTVEAVVHSTNKPAGSYSLIGKYIDGKNYWRVRFAYWNVQLIVRTTDGMNGEFSLFPFSMRGNDSGEIPVKLKFEIVENKVGFYVNDSLMCIFEDPLAGKVGKPGLASESTTYASHFKARRTK